MICSRCGENNPETYHFCGMCGGALQKPANGSTSVRADARPDPVRTAVSGSRAGNMAFSRAETRPDFDDLRPINRPATATKEHVEPISGPSLLGLNQPGPDSLRERAFSSVDTYFEPDERRPAWGRIFMALLILAALGAVAWWRYNNFGRPGEHGRPTALTAMNRTADPGAPPPQISSEPPSPENKAPGDEPKNAAAPASTSKPNDASKPGEASKPEEKDLPPSGSASPSPAPEAETADTGKAANEKAADKTAEPVRPATKSAKPAKSAKDEDETADTSVPKTPAKPLRAAVSPQGDALFRRGEAYLYGRGVPKSCDQAIKYLKSASEKSHPKARSTFGTMYATGHCVPRDLPTSYRWFALALQVDPNNTILEKDLSAIWNQMTPPERQLATKLRQ